MLSPLAGAVALVIGIGTIALGGQVSRALLAAASRFAGRWRREMVDKLPAAESVGVSHYRRTVALYMLQWLLLGSILVALCVPAERLHESTLVLSYLGALPAAVILGFVAIWAPGGIGVREGTLVAVLALTMPVELAAVAALVYRLWCVVIDLLNGLYALLHLRRANPASPADEG